MSLHRTACRVALGLGLALTVPLLAPAACDGNVQEALSEPECSSCGGGSTGGATGAECAAFRSFSGVTVVVHVTNESSQTLYLGQTSISCGWTPSLFSVSDANGGRLSEPVDCMPSCDKLIRGDMIGCPGICIYQPVSSLQPGESGSYDWYGENLVRVTLPDSCMEDPEVTTERECLRAERVEPGMYTFAIDAGTALDCSETMGGDCGTCEPMSDGGCLTQNALVGGETVTAEATVFLDASYGVGEEAKTGETRPVELVFVD
jgi:hypothetical protein